MYPVPPNGPGVTQLPPGDCPDTLDPNWITDFLFIATIDISLFFFL
jgi:hypothetical protein